MGKGMIDGCGANCAKYLLFMFNLIFFLAGAALLGVGIWIKVDTNFNRYLDIIKIDHDEKIVNAAIILFIAIGAVVFITGFAGCCGAIKESVCLLMVFATLMVILLFAELAAAILAIVFRNQLGDKLRESMIKQTKNELAPIKEDDNTPLNLAWSLMQMEFKCCGAESYKEYKNNPAYSAPTLVPFTCCKYKTTNSEKPDPTSPNFPYEECKTEFTADNPTEQLHNQGCYTSLKDWIQSRAAIIIGIGVGIAFFQIIGIVFACAVRRAIKGE